MSEWGFLKVDTWWKVVLIMGVFASVGALTFEIEVIENRHLLGLGLGMIFVGVGHWMAYKTISQFEYGVISSWKGMKHGPVSVLLILVGVVLVVLFFYLIITRLV